MLALSIQRRIDSLIKSLDSSNLVEIENILNMNIDKDRLPLILSLISELDLADPIRMDEGKVTK